ncbi:MAG: DHHA1 domain-containing protein, partial [Fusobacteriaceae bacterium]
KLHDEVDFIAIMNMKGGLSLRGIKGINLGEIAKDIGSLIFTDGGGHPNASAVNYTREIKQDFLSNIFNF